MKGPRVKRGKGPKSSMTEATYRKKALPFLLQDFERRCAYCLDPDEFRHPSQNHVDHFDCKLKKRQRHQYKNLMLACVTCNTCKHDKPVMNPFSKEQRILNCTVVNEFIEHIREQPDGQWEAIKESGNYHLESIGLREPCHVNKRRVRREMADRILSLFTTAIQYKHDNPPEIQRQIMEASKQLLSILDKFPPLVTENGVVSAREWLKDRGVVLD